ncbi:hypothetical protein JYT19_00610, partial [Sulfobacillus acidophilus]|nr:hypothetical protein [Sulfobacillus acidophilus]
FAILEVENNTFEVVLNNSNIDAKSGNLKNVQNYLAGTLTIDGETINLADTAIKDMLDPHYDEDKFYDSFLSCRDDIMLVEKSGICSFMQTLGENAARLIVQNAVLLTKVINNDQVCGFENIYVKLQPVEVVGDPGQMGSMSWQIEDCNIKNEEPTEILNDCLERKYYVEGEITAKTRRQVFGEREKIHVVVDSIIPRKPTDVNFNLQNIELNEFSAYFVDDGKINPSHKMTIHEGIMSAKIQPLVGERKDDLGRFDVATPIVIGHEINLNNANATINGNGMTFHVSLEDVNLVAKNGFYEGVGNVLSGSLVINGERIEFDDIILDPFYEQSNFDKRYQCKEELVAPLPYN